MIFENNLQARLRQKIGKKEFIVAAGVDSLSHINCCQENDCDLILLYPTSRYQNAQNRFLAGYLAFGNTNDLMLQTAEEMMPIVDSNNLLAGVNGSDPFKIDKILLKQMERHNFAGVHNYPSMSLVDGTFGINIEGLRLGVDKEVQLLKTAHEEGFFTCAMVRTQKQAMLMTRAGVDVIVFYLNLGEKTDQPNMNKQKRLHQDIHHLKELTTAVRNISKDIPLLFYNERLRTMDEIKSIVQEVPQINGYLLLPAAKQQISERRLKMEILQLKQL